MEEWRNGRFKLKLPTGNCRLLPIDF
jgi:hypothetical protein